MSLCLPTGGFYMYTGEKVAELDLIKFPDDPSICSLMEVDLFVDPALHNSDRNMAISV